MKMNKVMKGTALTALAAVTWLAAGTTDASAAKAANPIDFNGVNINTYNQTMSVDVGKGKAKEIHVGVGTFSKGKVKVSAWDVYEACEYEIYDEYEYENEIISGFGVGNVDLSKLNNTKDSYVAVKTDKSDPIYIKIPAAVKSQKATYNPGNFTLEIKNVKQGTSSDIKPETLEWQYRTSYGSWKWISPYGFGSNNTVVQNEIFQEFQQQGATLYIRSASTDSFYKDEKGNWYNMKPSGTVKDAADKSADPVEYPLYESGSFPGKESKVTIKKQANGPAVGVDYVKNTVKLAKDVEFRMILGDDYFSSELAGVKADSKVEVEKFFDATTTSAIAKEEAAAATSGVLEVRKKADASKKKSASKWTIVKIDKPQEMAIKAADAKNIDNDKGIVTTNSAVSFSVTNGSVSVKYIYKGTGDKAKYNDKVEITNSDSKLDYQVVIKSSAPASTDKATTVKKGKSAKVTAKKGDTIYIRVAGDKKEKRFAGKYTVVAKTIY